MLSKVTYNVLRLQFRQPIYKVDSAGKSRLLLVAGRQLKTNINYKN